MVINNYILIMNKNIKRDFKIKKLSKFDVYPIK